MSGEPKPELRLEIAHILFIDIVGYSKLLIDEQSESLEEKSGRTQHRCVSKRR